MVVNLGIENANPTRIKDRVLRTLLLVTTLAFLSPIVALWLALDGGNPCLARAMPHPSGTNALSHRYEQRAPGNPRKGNRDDQRQRGSSSRTAEPRDTPERTTNSHNNIEIVAVHDRQVGDGQAAQFAHGVCVDAAATGGLCEHHGIAPSYFPAQN